MICFIDTLLEMTTLEARAKFERSRAESTPQQRRDSAQPPPDPHESKTSEPDSLVDIDVRVLQCCCALANFNDVIRMTKAGAKADAYEEVVVEFCADIAELRIKTTLKIHIVDDHISSFVESTSGGFALAAYSEQAMES